MSARSCVVGIAGGSASGKTSLTRALMSHFQGQTPSPCVEMVSVDAFFREDRTQGPSFILSSGEEFFNFNHPDALDLGRLLNHIDSRSTAPDAPQILLLEGLMLLHLAAIRELLDVRVFVELEGDVRALRRLLRDMKGGRGITDPEWIARYYLESAKVGHEQFIEPSRKHADLIVRGDGDFTRTIPLLAGAITSTLASRLG